MQRIDLAVFEDRAIDSLVAIAKIDNMAVLQMNIDWLTAQLNAPKVPIAAGLWMSELLELLEAVKAKLAASE